MVAYSIGKPPSFRAGHQSFVGCADHIAKILAGHVASGLLRFLGGHHRNLANDFG